MKQAGENLRYINQNKTERWSRCFRIHRPVGRFSNASGKKIPTQDNLVKLKAAHPGLYQPGREDAPVPEPPLMVRHNLHPDQLAEVLRRGGPPSPSLGVPNSHVPYPNKLDAIQAIIPVLKKSVYPGSMADWNKATNMNYFFAAKVRIGKNEKMVFIRTKEGRGGNKKILCV